MNDVTLSGIERELVLQYLSDGNVPVTLSPLHERSDDKIFHPDSAVFPVSLDSSTLLPSENGKIILKNPPESLREFVNRYVKVEFYFNRVGLYFTALVKNRENSTNMEMDFPKAIFRIKDEETKAYYDFSASIYFDSKNGKIDVKCVPWINDLLFKRPVWKTIPLEKQTEAKSYLEEFVARSKIEGQTSNGIHLIPICNFLTYSFQKIESVQNRVKPLFVLYVDHERIVIASEDGSFSFCEGEELAFKFSFVIKESPAVSRDMFVYAKVLKLFREREGRKICADCVFTSMQEEDLRFIYEKTTQKLFI